LLAIGPQQWNDSMNAEAASIMIRLRISAPSLEKGGTGSKGTTMIKVIRSDERYHADRGWLDTRWHFSFDEYYDPANMNWGPSGCLTTTWFGRGQGFGSHAHRDMEIVTYVLEGELEHGDSEGHTGVIHPGEVQVMSAGTGIVHSEYNHSKEHPVHFLQLWIIPRTLGLRPRWEQHQFTRAERSDRLLPVVSSGDIPKTMKIDQDAAIHLRPSGRPRSNPQEQAGP
jgi:redox-sensitive bicupin YhaK (pirin superfamily)